MFEESFLLPHLVYVQFMLLRELAPLEPVCRLLGGAFRLRQDWAEFVAWLREEHGLRFSCAQSLQLDLFFWRRNLNMLLNHMRGLQHEFGYFWPLTHIIESHVITSKLPQFNNFLALLLSSLVRLVKICRLVDKIRIDSQFTTKVLDISGKTISVFLLPQRL